MSNYLALATVTAAIERLLSASVETDVAGAKVTLDRPDTRKDGPVVNVFMYQVGTNPIRSNDDLPGRRSDGSTTQRAKAAVDLSYLLTFHGDDLELEPQRLFGSVLRTLTSRPLITASLIDAVVTAAGGSPAKHPSLADSDLARADDLVRLTPRSMDLEQLSRLWAVFPETSYVLSSCWTASVVVVEDDETPVRSAPVVHSRLAVQQLGHPTIASVEDAADARAPLLAGVAWRIRGSQLASDRTVVRVGGQELTPTSVRSDELLVTVGPASTLRAGRVTVQVVQIAMLGVPPTRHGDLASAGTTVTLAPRVLSAAFDTGAVTVTVDIPVRAGQAVSVRLVIPADGRIAVVVPVEPPGTDTTSVTAAVPSAPGTYAVVLTVDGADSPLDRNPSGAITGPLVTVP